MPETRALIAQAAFVEQSSQNTYTNVCRTPPNSSGLAFQQKGSYNTHKTARQIQAESKHAQFAWETSMKTTVNCVCESLWRGQLCKSTVKHDTNCTADKRAIIDQAAFVTNCSQNTFKKQRPVAAQPLQTLPYNYRRPLTSTRKLSHVGLKSRCPPQAR